MLLRTGLNSVLLPCNVVHSCQKCCSELLLPIQAQQYGSILFMSQSRGTADKYFAKLFCCVMVKLPSLQKHVYFYSSILPKMSGIKANLLFLFC
jgi:hypothetical protein